MSTEKFLKINRSIQQVEDGKRYKGDLEIGGSKLDFNLDLTISIPDCEKHLPGKSIGELRDMVAISISKDGSEIEITDMEYGFFYEIIAMYANSFYYMPRIREINESELGGLMQKERLAASAGITASCGIGDTISCTLSPELREILGDKKFCLDLPD